MKIIRVDVFLEDGQRTWWYEKSTAKDPVEKICDRVTKRLSGLKIKRIEAALANQCIASWLT